MSYSRNSAPSTGGNAGVDQLAVHLDEELARVEQALKEFDLVNVKASASEPTKPRNGMIVYADGTNWNPGGGEGFYGYQAGAWVKL